MQEFIVTKSSVMKIQNLIVDHKSRPAKLNSKLNITNFYLSTFPAKINDKIFQINEKTLFCRHFCKNLWLSTTAMVNQHLDIKDTE